MFVGRLEGLCHRNAVLTGTRSRLPRPYPDIELGVYLCLWCHAASHTLRHVMKETRSLQHIRRPIDVKLQTSASRPAVEQSARAALIGSNRSAQSSMGCVFYVGYAEEGITSLQQGFNRNSEAAISLLFQSCTLAQTACQRQEDAFELT